MKKSVVRKRAAIASLPLLLTGIVLGLPAGSFTGAVIGYATGGDPACSNPANHDERWSGMFRIVPRFAGMAVGGVMGGAAPVGDADVDPGGLPDLLYFKKSARYEDEPPDFLDSPRRHSPAGSSRFPGDLPFDQMYPGPTGPGGRSCPTC